MLLGGFVGSLCLESFGFLLRESRKTLQGVQYFFSSIFLFLVVFLLVVVFHLFV